jgi:hypothetical protein
MLAILTTHPIQYQVPLWQALARDGRVPFEVWYLTDHGTRRSRDREFGQTFAWDIDTLSGYTHRFLDVDQRATPASFWKCRLRERLRDRLRASHASALWIQGWQVAAYWQGVREARAAGVEVWLRGESNDLAPQPRWKGTLKRARNGWLFRRVDKFFYIGKGNRRLYEESGVLREKLFFAPYAVDNEHSGSSGAFLKNRSAFYSAVSSFPRSGHWIWLRQRRLSWKKESCRSYTFYSSVREYWDRISDVSVASYPIPNSAEHFQEKNKQTVHLCFRQLPLLAS